MDDELLSISEVAARTGLQSSALRYYERAGLIRSETRIGGRRHFDASVVHKLAFIALLQEVGFTISQIKTLLTRRGGRRQWRLLAEEKLREIDDHIEKVQSARELLAAAVACECSGLDRCDLVRQRRGRHRKAVQRLSLPVGSPRKS